MPQRKRDVDDFGNTGQQITESPYNKDTNNQSQTFNSKFSGTGIVEKSSSLQSVSEPKMLLTLLEISYKKASPTLEWSTPETAMFNLQFKLKEIVYY